MPKKVKKTYSPAERKRRNRRFNAILYTIAAILILGGTVLIISDQTLLFPKLFSCIGKKYHEITTGETPVPMPTLPPPDAVITNPPDGTQSPVYVNPFINHTFDPYDDPWYTDEPEPTLPPGVTPDPNATPRPTRVPRPPATPVPVYAYAPKNVYFLDQYIAASIDDIVCPVDPVGYNSQGQMNTVHSAFRAGWFMYGGDPVTGGNTLIAGHNRYSGRYGYFSVVKDKMAPGDIVIVEMQNGEYAYYRVDSIEQYPYDDVPSSVMNTGGTPRLTLITCLGDYSSIIHTSRHRVIAICYPINFGSETEPPETNEPELSLAPDFTPGPAIIDQPVRPTEKP